MTKLSQQLLEGSEAEKIVFFSVGRYGDVDRGTACANLSDVEASVPGVKLTYEGGGGGTTDLSATVPASQLKAFRAALRRALGKNLVSYEVTSADGMERQETFGDMLQGGGELDSKLPPGWPERVAAKYGFTINKWDAERGVVPFQDDSQEQQYISRHKLRALTGLDGWNPTMLWRYLALRDASLIDARGTEILPNFQ